MKCPYCSSNSDMVVDSRPLEEASIIRRRRECTFCHKRYTTYERLETVPIIVVKRDRIREPFSRDKVRNGILAACRKRPISADTIEKIVSEIEYEVQEYGMEIPSRMIGEKIIARLRILDDVAYVRFVSVYRKFDTVNTFLEEINNLREKSKEK
ncbi:transcriptional regulator NrdR [bacterium]